MSSVINNSNKNSALVNTLLASDSVMNPNVYSIKPIVPPHSLTYARCLASNGQAISNSNMNFQLNKYGIMSQILFSYTKTHDNAVLPQYDFLTTIKEFELLSSSRVVSTITKYDILSMCSNLEQSKLVPIARNALDARTIGTVHKFTMPLMFGFMLNESLQLNSTFLEPLSIRVSWDDVGDAINAVISDVELNIRYKNYDEVASAKILAENYNAPILNQLASRWYDENIVTETQTVNVNASMSVELKNTDCVANFYIILKKTADLYPVPITKIVFTGSGQEICSLTREQLEYARIDTDGFAIGNDDFFANGNLYNIAKIQTGVYGNGVLSNVFSLRQINAPKITVFFNADAAVAYDLQVCEDTSAIYSTASSTGRLDISLSN
jgi:hypothetical protein